ncbi:nucleoside/nucleotide kinase family protein [Arthrobacter gengyunqii]|uniref:Nucleoside/nucleotide kinase family protein n=1 Tax=Arthrobacter gengyunqii TaxID=2886940 RepID=A0A9X1LZR1_9MICC|nr:nucleoside/nucleotide kinase family protein [Arthrobacter gengyunqii]MCC3268614.1 nucleoside/nucleotide kinase family protein [Arthrobacter gengyunqii]UOY96002.1 nucleoside/nucleotide kinase family protein [Arthrobacter gengyunqii]
METSPARHESMDPAELIQRARSLACSGTRRILGITGAPGSGKSTVARLLVDALGPDTAALVPMDGFHLANSLLKDLGRQQRKGAPDTFDDGGYAALLARLHGQSAEEPQIYAPDFRRELEESIGSALPVRATVPLVITEGNYLLLQEGHWPHARTLMDEVWYLEIDDVVRRKRLIRRHAEFGRTPDEARAWALGSDEANARLIIGHAHRADIRIRLDARPA